MTVRHRQIRKTHGGQGSPRQTRSRMEPPRSGCHRGQRHRCSSARWRTSRSPSRR
ncbi:hypothetical protein M6B38_416210 [Iris pallida]|uniref:Uncharacterized protein n=1 Tax=Iris pallida TaxID=29817 RepID=A0AAX6FJ18_IRIPA|nr:hypothetical protein M6B38_416210 [Iris pallida]